MKKLILTLIAAGFVFPAFAFDFNDGNFIVDTELKNEISKQIISSFNDNIKTKICKKQKEEPQLLAKIRQEMEHTKAIVERYANFRPNTITRAFITSQKEQKIAYEKMLYWDVPSQIYNYINDKFGETDISNIRINCRYTNSTAIEVTFDYLGKSYTIVYNYNPNYQFGQEIPIDVIENNLQK